MDPLNKFQVHFNGPRVTSGPTSLRSIYDGPKIGMKGPLWECPLKMGMKGPTYTRSIDNGLEFYFKDPLKGIKHMHKGTFLREVAKSVHELESRVLGFDSHNDIYPYTSPHSRVQTMRIVRVVSDNSQIFLTRFE